MDEMDGMGLVIIGHRSSKSTFCANKSKVESMRIVIEGLTARLQRALPACKVAITHLDPSHYRTSTASSSPFSGQTCQAL